MPRRKPPLSRYCRCGAQWHGRHVVDNQMIRDHTFQHGALIDVVEFMRLGYQDKAPPPDPPSKTNLARWRKKQGHP